MSYLSSVLASLSNNAAGESRSNTQSPANAASLSAPRPAPAAVQNKVAPGNNTSKPSSNPSLKRKSEEQPLTAPDKAVRKDAPHSRPPTSQPITAPRPSTAYAGTARPGNLATPGQISLARSTATLGLKVAAATSTSRPSAAPAAPTTATPMNPPKKGSYKDILARAAANQKAQANFGKVTHKPVEKISRRERLRREEEEAAKHGKSRYSGSGPSGGVSKSGLAGRVASGPKSALVAPKEKPKRQPIDLGYKGTMRAQPSTSGASSTKTGNRPGLSASRHSSYNPGPYTYSATPSGSELDEDDDDEDEGGRGFDELMEEEEASLRAARKEDAEALRQENEHRREKEERRKKLAALAASKSRK